MSLNLTEVQHVWFVADCIAAAFDEASLTSSTLRVLSVDFAMATLQLVVGKATEPLSM